MQSLVCLGDWERIDKWLTKKFSFSRNFFHHIIERWWILVNGKKIKKSYKLKSWEKITVDDLQRYLSPVILEEAPDIDIPVLIEEKDFLVLNKPKWVLSHPNSVWDVKHPSVVGFLYHRFKWLPTVGNFIRSGLIHRLDKDTDGLMVVVKTEKWLAHFKGLFQQKSQVDTILDKENVNLKKFYHAKSVLTAKWKEFLKNIENNLPYLIDELVIAKVPHSVAKRWLTKIIDFKIKDNFVLLDIEILTGRTHQIRFHLSQCGLPIFGDYLYGEETEEKMCLTAYKLMFDDLDGVFREVEHK